MKDSEYAPNDERCIEILFAAALFYKTLATRRAKSTVGTVLTVWYKGGDYRHKTSRRSEA